MEKILLLSTAYSWFVGLLVVMALMSVLFVLIAFVALRPYKFDGGISEKSHEPMKLLENKEAELTAKLLHGDAANREETERALRDVSTAKRIVKELVDIDKGYTGAKSTLGVDNSLTAEEAASLDSDEQVAIEQTFNGADGENGVKKSFSANLIQSDDETKVWYFELKNCLLCYEKTKVRMHWYNEKFYVGRNNVATLTMRGKTLCLYLAVNADEYSDRFPVKNSTSDMYKEVTPCLFRIKNDKGVKLAKELIALLMSDYGVMYVRTNHSIYALPYEDDDALVARGLVRQVGQNGGTDVDN